MDNLPPAELLIALRATETRVTYATTSRTSPPVKGEYQALVNPQGPQAADTIERLEARVAELEALLIQRSGKD